MGNDMKKAGTESREVQENQKVIDTGLYGVVRHPMYMATTILFLAMPLVLASPISFIIMLGYTGAIYLYTVLVSPLLAFLPYTVIDHDYTVIAHSANNGLGDAAAGGDFTKTGFGGNGIDDIAAGTGRKIGRTDHRDRCGHFFHLAVSGKAGDNYFIKLQVLVEYICRIRNIFLSGRCHTYRKQRQCKYAPLQRHNKEYTKKCAKIILIMGIPEIIPH